MAVLVLQAWALRHELAVGRQDLNDHVFHVALVEGCVEAIRGGGNPVDFWAAEWSLGYPVLRTYQPLGHLLVAGLHLLSGLDIETLFSGVRYALLCLWPLSVFASVRWLGLGPQAAAAATVLAPLLATDGRFGLELGSYLWRGSGLYTQSLAMHGFALSLGLGSRALRSGRHLVTTGVLLGATGLAHFIYGYMAALSLILLAAVERPRGLRLRRMVAMGAASFLLALPILVPLLVDAPRINQSRWEPGWKWDSHGAPEILSWLWRGELLDAGRFPILSLLALLGASVVGWQLRAGRSRPAATFTLAGAALWLGLYFGRPTWGGALELLGLGPLTHLHRLIGGLHFFLLLLAALGLVGVWRALAAHPRAGRPLALVATLLLITPAVLERLSFLGQNRTWGETNLQAHRAEAASLAVALDLAEQAPGRVFPGLAAGWGGDFRVGWVPLSAHLSQRRIPALAYLYHSMARTGDLMVLFDEERPEHYRLFHVSTVLAPRHREAAPLLERAGRPGPFQLWQMPPGPARSPGYFDLVKVEHTAVVD
ncbi:MAG: hypothetical protein MI919_05100, partial [Holophagales bacterium]|nr:hypothetical protein [Holophagales bacterium]